MHKNFYYPRKGDEMTKQEIDVFHRQLHFIKEVKENEEPKKNKIVLHDITQLCPRSGFPDFADFNIVYESNKIIDKEELWKYLQRYRYTYISHEAITGEICKFIKELTDSKYVKVVGKFYPRGNLGTYVVCEINENDESKILEEFNREEIERVSQELKKKFKEASTKKKSSPRKKSSNH